MNASYLGLKQITCNNEFGMVFVFNDEDSAEVYADEMINEGFHWICFGGYFNAFGLPNSK